MESTTGVLVLSCTRTGLLGIGLDITATRPNVTGMDANHAPSPPPYIGTSLEPSPTRTGMGVLPRLGKIPTMDLVLTPDVFF
jgi:hypothetical protein